MPPWSTIETIMFDMDGTLLDLHFDNFFWLKMVPQCYAKIKGITNKEAITIINSKYRQVYGTLNWYCVDYWEKELQLNITKLKIEISHKILVRPNALKLLSELQLLNKKMLLVTNAHPRDFEIKARHTGISKFFYKCISSHQLNLAKENLGFWRELQKFAPYDAERTLLFDDSVEVLQQAQREGVKYLYGIKQPDSHGPALKNNEFPLIEDFGHIMPS